MTAKNTDDRVERLLNAAKAALAYIENDGQFNPLAPLRTRQHVLEWLHDAINRLEKSDMNYIDHTEIEARARRIAATKMGLVKDPDGLRLPDELWRQCWQAAVQEAERDRKRLR